MTADDEMVDRPKSHRPPKSRPDKSGLPIAPNDMPRPQYVNVTDMIRSLQRTEGHSDCFRRGLADCDQIECAWRQYCLEKAESLHKSK
jgi:hypothetical protein